MRYNVFTMYTFKVIAMKKNGAKVAYCISTCLYCSENSSLNHWGKAFTLVVAYQSYTQSVKNILFVLVTSALLWLQINDAYRKLNHKVGYKNKGR